MIECLITLTVLSTVLSIVLFIKMKRAKRIGKIYRDSFHKMRHDLTTPLMVLESSYEVTLGELGEVNTTPEDKKKLKYMKDSIAVAMSVLRRFGRFSNKLPRI